MSSAQGSRPILRYLSRATPWRMTTIARGPEEDDVMTLRSGSRFPFGARLVTVLAAALVLGGTRSQAHAAIAHVGTIGGTGTKTAGTTLAVTVGAPGVAAGDTIIVSFAMDPAAGAVTCADTKGNTYS